MKRQTFVACLMAMPILGIFKLATGQEPGSNSVSRIEPVAEPLMLKGDALGGFVGVVYPTSGSETSSVIQLGFRTRYDYRLKASCSDLEKVGLGLIDTGRGDISFFNPELDRRREIEIIACDYLFQYKYYDFGPYRLESQPWYAPETVTFTHLNCGVSMLSDGRLVFTQKSVAEESIPIQEEDRSRWKWKLGFGNQREWESEYATKHSRDNKCDLFSRRHN